MRASDTGGALPMPDVIRTVEQAVDFLQSFIVENRDDGPCWCRTGDAGHSRRCLAARRTLRRWELHSMRRSGGRRVA